MRVLAHDTAKVIPHLPDNLLPSRCVEVRHRPTQVLVRSLASPQPGTYRPAHKTAECRRGIKWQPPHHRGEHPKQRALERMRDLVAPKSETAVFEVIGRHVFCSLSPWRDHFSFVLQQSVRELNITAIARVTTKNAPSSKFLWQGRGCQAVRSRHQKSTV
jgi:hypothetical protein